MGSHRMKYPGGGSFGDGLDSNRNTPEGVGMMMKKGGSKKKGKKGMKKGKSVYQMYAESGLEVGKKMNMGGGMDLVEDLETVSAQMMKKGGSTKKKKQGYNSRLDESLGMRNKGKKKQSFKSRRDESKGMKKSKGKRAYSGNKSSAQGKKK